MSPPRLHLARLTLLAALLLGAAALRALWLFARAAEPAPAPEAAATRESPHAGRDDATFAATTTQAPPQRTAATPPAEAGAQLDFPARIEALVQVGMATSHFAQNDEIERAKASDARARSMFAELLRQYDDAGERALQLLLDYPARSDDVHDNATCRVSGMVLAAELTRREEQADRFDDRRLVDTLTANVLEVLPLGERLADCAAPTLIDRPHLRLVHEPAVLHLVALAGEQQFSRELATRLLLTLWHNLQQFGERSSTDLACLALLQLGDADPSQRIAACRHLLSSARYRPAVLAWLREHQDLDVANEAARIAARELPAADALATLRELTPLLPEMPAAYMALAHRAPDALADSYEQLLADNVQPATRRDLLAGLGMDEAGRQRGTLELALQNDPDPTVRLQALLSLSASAAQQCGEAACTQLLDDPLIAGDPERLSVVVMALQNLEVAGMTNAIDRLGRRLRAMRLPEH
ncbi:MAG: hypothetical protein KDC48_09235, partial [Planctomycetes bacterium]|nr:hypothetical protein [Planctomycetota bacterium]